MEGNHFAINKTADVIPFLKAIQKMLKGKGDLEATILDIKGCFPNMPRETIRFALRKIAQEFKQTMGHKGVWVPTRTETQACTWTKRKYGTQFLPFELMLDVMDFALDNAIVKMPDGQLMRQVGGIPMGDPLSPGMTIGACAWMEKEWMQTLTEKDKEMFGAKRFMDDILLIKAKNESWDYERFTEDFIASECYQKPLELEPGNEGTFLEVRYKIEGDQIRYKLKNDNENGDNKIWRYQHYESNSPEGQKQATLAASLTKAHKYASDIEMLREGAIAKINEFVALDYPTGVLKRACGKMWASTREPEWLRIKRQI